MRPFIQKVKLRQYKSIALCDVSLGPLTVLVGRNGAGKSNFLDSLSFVRDSLDRSLDHALERRGGVEDVRRRSTGHPRTFSIEMECNLCDGQVALYGFAIGARKGGRFAVDWEYLRSGQAAPSTLRRACFERCGEEIEASVDHPPDVQTDRLYLERASGIGVYRQIYESLASMSFYELNPDAMRQLHGPGPKGPLHSDGRNVASVLGRLGQVEADLPRPLDRLNEYLRAIAPRISGVERVELGPKETFVYREQVAGTGHPWRFYGSSMSDGSLRVLGILAAIFQPGTGTRQLPLVGIEEPEMALHPAAISVLVDALHEATEHRQLVVTTHSPDLIDELTVPPDRLLIVVGSDDGTQIAPVDAGNREAIHRHLSTAGELLKMDHLQPDRKDLEEQERSSPPVPHPA